MKMTKLSNFQNQAVDQIHAVIEVHKLQSKFRIHESESSEEDEFSAVISLKQRNIEFWIYSDEASIVGDGIAERFEKFDYDSESDLLDAITVCAKNILNDAI
jgi:hypothetical protein